jgi:glyoxylase-like metal-dependent hydrolase (beta-lactamase superfamily II)
MEIAKDIHFYTSDKYIHINTVIVKGDGLLLIDPGINKKRVCKELSLRIQQDKLDLSDLLWIVHTHCHWDHINATEAFRSVNKAKIAAGKADVPFIEDRQKNMDALLSSFEGHEEFAKEVSPYPLLTRLFSWLSMGKQPKIRVDKPLMDNDEIDIGVTVRAISIPGHTSGHTGYYMPDTGTLAYGDLIDFKHAQGLDMNCSLSDYASALKSIEKVICLEPEIIIPGHGEPIIGRTHAKAELDKALSTGLEYPKKIRRAMGTGPIGLKQLMYNAFPDTKTYMEPLNMMLVLTVLVHMEKQGAVRKVSMRKGKSAWSRAD